MQRQESRPLDNEGYQGPKITFGIDLPEDTWGSSGSNNNNKQANYSGSGINSPPHNQNNNGGGNGNPDYGGSNRGFQNNDLIHQAGTKGQRFMEKVREGKKM